jgi:hypothetical protein
MPLSRRPGTRDHLCPPHLDDQPITEALPASDDATCATRHPDCPRIRCRLALGHHGLCWRVDQAPYRASYWEKPK